LLKKIQKEGALQQCCEREGGEGEKTHTRRRKEDQWRNGDGKEILLRGKGKEKEGRGRERHPEEPIPKKGRNAVWLKVGAKGKASPDGKPRGGISSH